MQSAYADVFVAAAGWLSSQREEGGCELASVISKTLWCLVILRILADEKSGKLLSHGTDTVATLRRWCFSLLLDENERPTSLKCWTE